MIDQSFLNEKPSLREEVVLYLLESLSINDEFTRECDNLYNSLVKIFDKFIKLKLRTLNIAAFDELLSYNGPYSNKVKGALSTFISTDNKVQIELQNMTVLRNNIFKYYFIGSIHFINRTIDFNFYLYDYPDKETYISNIIIGDNYCDLDNNLLTISCVSYSNSLNTEILRDRLYHEFFHLFQIPKMKNNDKELDLYNLSLSLINYKIPIVKDIAYAVYSSNQKEIDANINVLYASLMDVDKTNIRLFWKVFENSRIIKDVEFIDKNFLDLEDDITYCKQVDDGIEIINKTKTKFCYNFILPRTILFKRLKNARKYVFAKLGKIITRVAEQKGLTFADLMSYRRHIYY